MQTVIVVWGGRLEQPFWCGAELVFEAAGGKDGTVTETLVEDVAFIDLFVNYFLLSSRSVSSDVVRRE